MGYFLFLDDERSLTRKGDYLEVDNGTQKFRFDIPENLFIAKSYDDAVEIVESEGCPQFISFDHDLGTTKTGMSFAKWLLERDMDLDGKFIPEDFRFTVHSANPVGAQNIKALVERYLVRRDVDQGKA